MPPPRRPSWRRNYSSSCGRRSPPTSDRSGSSSSASCPRRPPERSSASVCASSRADPRAVPSKAGKVMRDLKFAVRLLLKAPVFTLTAVLTLALCIGANTAIYTVVDRVLLRPLPYPQPERLAAVVTRFAQGVIGQGQTGGTWEALAAGVSTVDLAASSGG